MNTADPVKLNEVERRVLGALMEKSYTQPEYYPMTLNALVAACNQKSNRDPVMELDESAVYSALDTLRQKGLAAQVLPAPGARTDRWKHLADSFFKWERREGAVMTELLLRGPQTLGELRTRCSRMMPFNDLEAVTIVLDLLGKHEPPLAATLPREPGQSAIRYTHLLYPDDEQPRPAAPVSTPHAVSANAGPAPAASTAPALAFPDIQALQSRINLLEEQVQSLEGTVADLTARLEAIENLVK